MKLNRIIFTVLAGALTLSSCSDFLDENPKGQLSNANFFSSQDELNMAVYALYSQVTNTQVNTNPWIWRWAGDDLTTTTGSNKQAYEETDGFHPSNTNKGVDALWNTSYSVIKAANYIVESASKTPTSQNEINIAIGQAKVWRAIQYFYLVRAFGPLPMNLTGDIDYERPLSSVADVYAQIEKDLKDAIELLPTSYTGEPRNVSGANVYVTKQAAMSALVAVYMAEGGWPLNNNSKYAEAAAMAKQVIDGVNSGTYEYIIEPSYYDVYAPSHNYSKECVLGINFGTKFGYWWEDSQMSSCNMYVSLGGWGDGLGEIQFWKDFPEGVRKDATYNKKVLYDNGRNTTPGDPNNGKLMDWWEKCAPGYNEYQPLFRIWSVCDGPSDYDYTKPASGVMCTDQRHRLIRYSEVLLWYAEAQARSTGTPDALAYKCLNKVRTRAGEAEVSGLSAADFADLCVKEHGWEVAGYWVALVSRREDQLRMNTLKDNFDRRKANAAIEVAPGVSVKEKVTIPQSQNWENEKTIYLPYPSFDSELNGNLKR